jgi:tetratricopeptide (TPR) repeat protein
MLRAIEAARDRTMRLEESNYTTTQRVQDVVFNVGAADAYAAAFRDYGIDLATSDPSDAAARLRARPIVRDLALAIDDWAFLKPADAGGRLVDLARRIDPDPDRDRARAFIHAPADAIPADRSIVDDHAFLERLPPRTLVLLAFALRAGGRNDDAGTVIDRAALRYPADLWVNDVAGLFQCAKTRPDINAASRYFRAVIALRPDLTLGYSNLANQLLQFGEYAEAERLCRHVLAIEPDNTFVRTLLSDLRTADSRWDDARRELEEGLRRAPQSNILENRLAEVEYFRGDPAAAERRLDAILARQPRFYPARCQRYTIRAIAFLSDGSDAGRRALETMRDELLRDFPDRAIVLQSVGDAETMLGRPDRGLKHLRRCVELLPSNTGAWQSYARGLFNAGDLDRAEAAAARSVALAPGNATALAITAEIRLARNDPAGALQTIRRAAALTANHADVLRVQIECERRNGLIEDAIATSERLCALWPLAHNWTTLSELAETIRPDLARAACEKALAQQPDQVAVALRLASLQLSFERDAEGADATLRRQLDRTPAALPLDRARLIAGRAAIARHRERYDEALELFRSAQQTGRNDSSLLWINGEVIATLKLAGRRDQLVERVVSTVSSVQRQYAKSARGDPNYASFLAQGCLHLLDVAAYREAEPLARECLELREYLDEPRWIYLNGKALLGRALAGQGKYAEAEAYLVPGYRGLVAVLATIPSGGRNRVFEAGQALAALYEATNRPAEAAATRATLPRELAPFVRIRRK